MKRLFGVVLAAALVLGMSVQGFANTVLLDMFNDVLLEDESGLTKFGTLVTSTLTEERKDYLRDFFSVMCGNSEPNGYHYYIISDSKGKRLFFTRVANNPVAFYKITKAVNTSVIGSMHMFLPYKSTVFTSDNYNEVDTLLFEYSDDSCQYNFSYHYDETGSWNSLDKFSGTNKLYFNGAYLTRPNYLSSSSVLLWSSDSSFNADLDLSLYNLSYNTSSSSTEHSLATVEEIEQCVCSYPVGLAFVDDDGLIDSVSPEPTPTPEPDEDDGENAGDSADDGDSSGGELPEFPDSSTDDTDTTIQLPEIDYDPNLVPYDLDVWDTIPKALMPQLKKVVSIAFPIILICFGLEAFVLIVRHLIFAWLHKGGGGGGVSVD